MMKNTKLNIVSRYDDICYKPEHIKYFGNSDFINFGYWDEDTGDQKKACENLMEKLLSFIPDKSGNILDVACGKGATTRYLLKYFEPHNITGINISEKQLQTAASNAPGCNFLLMDAVKLDFPESAFDNIICVEAAFHFNTRKKFLREASRVLRPGGHLVLSDILMNREAERYRSFRTEKNYVRDLREYSDVLCSTGFQDVKVIDATEPCWKGHFWNVVCYFHNKFLLKEIAQEELKHFLDLTYKRVPDTEYYLLAHARKA